MYIEMASFNLIKKKNKNYNFKISMVTLMLKIKNDYFLAYITYKTLILDWKERKKK